MQVTLDTSEFKQVFEGLDRIEKAGKGDTTQRALMAGGFIIEAFTKINIAKQGLIQTSDLINSIGVYDATPRSVYVGSRGVVYAAIHEFGGVIHPRYAKYLAWKSKTGEWIFAKSVTIPARPYLRPAVDENKGHTMDAIRETIAREIV